MFTRADYSNCFKGSRLFDMDIVEYSNCMFVRVTH